MIYTNECHSDWQQCTQLFGSALTTGLPKHREVPTSSSNPSPVVPAVENKTAPNGTTVATALGQNVHLSVNVSQIIYLNKQIKVIICREKESDVHQEHSKEHRKLPFELIT